jgi:hypothetical protein
MTTAADELRAASARLRELARAVDADIATNPYWASEEYPPHDYPNLYARGVDNGLGGPAGTFAAAIGPTVGTALAKVFDAWARMADLDPDLLNRIGGEETLTLARLIDTGSQT